MNIDKSDVHFVAGRLRGLNVLHGACGQIENEAVEKVLTEWLAAKRFGLPHLARQFDLMAKGCRSIGLESLEGEYDNLRQDANAGKIELEPIVEAIDYDYRNGHDGRAAAELLVGALLKDALRSAPVTPEE